MNYENYIYQQPIDPARQAILLAMTQSMEQEKEMIRSCKAWASNASPPWRLDSISTLAPS